MPHRQLIVHDLHASAHPGQYAAGPLYAGEVTHVALSEVLAAMSRALDITEGRSEGHTVRTCIIGMRIASELDLSAFDKVALYGALLLKDSGVGSTSHIDELVEAESPTRRPLISLSSISEKTKDAIHNA